MAYSPGGEAESLDIAVVGPFDENIPARGDGTLKYGGIERVAAGLVDDLNRQGHRVTLFASGGSTVPDGVELFECTPQAVRHMEEAGDSRARLALSMRGLRCAVQNLRGRQYDIIHWHYGPEWMPLILRDAAGLTTPSVTTFHGPLSQPSHLALFSEDYKQEPVVSISNDQRGPMPDLNYIATVYNGVDTERLQFSDTDQGYLAFLGRFSPDKGPEDAIKIAVKTGRNLIMAAKVDPKPTEREYYDQRIQPLLRRYQGLVEFVGEVDDKGKNELLGGAAALLAPVAKGWREPFGLAYAEANACGTPVVGRPHGAVHEVIEHGKTGLLYRDVDTMIRHINKGDLGKLRRADCRERVERMFSYRTMTLGYVAVYEQVIAGSPTSGKTGERELVSAR